MPTADHHPPLAEPLPFDERPTTINAVLAVWAGLIAGVVVALGGFEDPRWTHNAWVRLMTLGATAGALAWGLQTPRAAIARRVQLGVAISLVLHTLLVVGLSQIRMHLVADNPAQPTPEPTTADEAPQPPAAVVVDQRPPDEQPAFERPVASAAPTLETPADSIERSAPRIDDPRPLALAPDTPAPRLAALPSALEPPRVVIARRNADRRPRDHRARAVLDGVEPAPVTALAAPTKTTPRPPAPIAEPPRRASIAPPFQPPTAAPEMIADERLEGPPRREPQTPAETLASIDRPRPAPPRRPAPTVRIPSAPLSKPDRPTPATDTRAAAPLRPAELALERARGGFAGLARSRNASLDRLASPQFPDELAGAASRGATTQPDQADAAAPRRRPDRPRSRASADAPSSTLPVNAAADATVAGSSSPGQANATSSAARTREDSPAPVAEPTSVAGQQAVDTGRARIVPDLGEGRGAAGGRPRLSLSDGGRLPAASRRSRIAAALGAPLPLTSPAEQRPLPAADRPAPPPAAPLGALDTPLLAAQPGEAFRGPAPPITPPAPRPLRGAEAAGLAPVRFALRDSALRPRIDAGAPQAGTDSPREDSRFASLPTKPLGLPAEFRPRRGVGREAPGNTARPGTRRGQSIRDGDRRPAAAYNNRGRRQETLLNGGQGRTAPKTEVAIELGLAFIAELQRTDGRWSFASLGSIDVPRDEVPNVRADAAATGLALLSLLGAGYDHYGGQYRQSVESGLDYLVSIQKPSGELFPEESGRGEGPTAAWGVARFYSHGIATIALCEAYGMTGDASLRGPAQRALDYIVATQVGRQGGWRYTPGVNSDLSVSGWQMMALKSGELAGLRVDRRAYDGVARFLEACRERSGRRARFCYNPNAPASDARTRHGRLPGTVMTSVGLLMQLYLGEPPTSARARFGADHLRENLPTHGEAPADRPAAPARTSTLGNPLRDTYYWYYATQVMYQMGGEYWSAWSDALRPLLIESQTVRGPLRGSWNPRTPTPDKWAPFGGRLYVTAMNLLSLEVSYRHLPLYGERIKQPR